MNRNDSRSTMARLFELYRKIPSYRHHGVTTKYLHQSLVEEGYLVSKRTVERDLKTLQELTELECERTVQGNVWRQVSVNADLQPTMQSTEALLLILAEKFLMRSLPPSSQKVLEQRLGKAHKTISKVNALDKWQGKLHVIGGQIPYHNEDLSTQWRQNIYNAVLNEEQITLIYKKLDSDVAQEYELNPLAIIVREHSHYLVATKTQTPNTPQLFNFMRMQDATSTFMPIESPRDFNLDDYIASNPTGWLLTKSPQQVRLKVRWFAHDWLLHNKLHPSQTISELEDEWYEVKFHGFVTYDLVGWVLRFSTDVVVLESSRLKKEVMNRVLAMYEEYQ